MGLSDGYYFKAFDLSIGPIQFTHGLDLSDVSDLKGHNCLPNENFEGRTKLDLTNEPPLF